MKTPEKSLRQRLLRLVSDFVAMIFLSVLFLGTYPYLPNFLRLLLHVLAGSMAVFLMSPMLLYAMLLVWMTLLIFERRRAWFGITALFGLGTLTVALALWSGVYFAQPGTPIQVIHLPAFQFSYVNAVGIGLVVALAIAVSIAIVRFSSGIGFLLWDLVQPVVNKWIESLVARMRSLLHISA